MSRGFMPAVSWRQHPEWSLLPLICAAWLALIWGHSDGAHVSGPSMGMSIALSHHHGHSMAGGWLTSGQDFADTGRWRSDVGHWLLMSLAMMAPVTLPAVRFVALNSLRTRRWRAMTGYLLGFIGVWAAVGAIGLIVVRLAWSVPLIGQGWHYATSSMRPLLAVAALFGAAGWQVSRGKRRALNDCTRVIPLRPLGWRADVSCGSMGVLHGWRCVRSCWALMLALTVAGAGVAWMIGMTMLVLGEEHSSFGRRLLWPSAVALSVLAIGVLLAR